jgi:cytoskeletal protein CcmA (bactofilin family)
LSEKKNSAIYPKKRTDTLIGSNVRIEGNIRFAGVLRVQGDIVGNVGCPDDRRGTMFVDPAGSVVGAVQVPHLVVWGRVRGPTHSAQSLEIHAGAHCVGDTAYQTIDVHFGGILEGLLTPSAGSTVDDSAPETPIPVVESSAPDEPGPPLAEASPRSGQAASRRKLALGAMLAIAVLAVLWVGRQPAEPPRVSEPAAVEAAAASAPVEAALAAAGDGAPDGTAAGVAATAAAAASASRAEAKAAPAPAPALLADPDPEMKQVATVQGLNPAKPGDIVFLITSEPSVLFKKQREEASAGQQIELARGRNVSMAIARNELLRVAKGREIAIFYQGRKVPPANIESGVWMRFVPQLPSAAENPGDPR